MKTVHRSLQQFSFLAIAATLSFFATEQRVKAQQQSCIITNDGTTVCGKPSKVKTPQQSAIKKQKVLDKDYSIVFILNECKRIDSSVKCNLSMKNSGQEVQFSVKHETSKIVDSVGKSYSGYEARYAGVNSAESMWSGQIRLFPGIDYSIDIKFNNVPEETTKIPILIITTNRGGNLSYFEMQFKNVSIVTHIPLLLSPKK
jgi:hypothetical protein